MIEYTTYGLIFALGLLVSNIAKDGTKQVEDLGFSLDTTFRKILSALRQSFVKRDDKTGSVQEGEDLILKK